MATYQIYELSARAVMSYAVEQDGVYTFALNRSATEHCKVPGARHEQDSCAMFHQLMYQLHGKGWRERGEEYAQVVDKACCSSHTHTSFQIRMPYIKGMLHQVDFKDFLKRSGTQTIVDIWGKAHPVRSVDIILTRSQFKAYGWLRENCMTWEDYWDAFRDYNHALYITNLSKTEPEKLVELNYQFLSTLSIQPEEFRPADLPEGWDHSPADDPRQWLTKATETAYYNFRANEAYQQEYFRRGLSQPRGSRANIMARVLEKNPKFIREPIYTEQLDGQARKILRGYAVGRLLVPGDNRFLSGDLLELLRQLIAPRVFQLPGERDFCNQVMGDFSLRRTASLLLVQPMTMRTAALFSAIPTSPGMRNCSCRYIQRVTNCANTTWATSPMWSWCLRTV